MYLKCFRLEVIYFKERSVLTYKPNVWSGSLNATSAFRGLKFRGLNEVQTLQHIKNGAPV